MSDFKNYNIFPNPIIGLEERFSKGDKRRRNTPDEIKIVLKQRAELTNRRIESLKPITAYLDELGLKNGKDYSALSSIGYVFVGLTSKQAMDLEKQPYVSSVQEEQIIKALSGN